MLASKHERADADAETSVEQESMNRVVPENDQEDESNVEKIAMQVLEY